MGVYKYLKQLIKSDAYHKGLREKMVTWRREFAVTRVEHPTRPDRAHALGYKAKQGVVVVRVRVLRGGKQRPRPKKGRQGKKLTVRKINAKNYRMICEERGQKKYPNMEVINSYWVGQDGKYIWYEVIMADPMHANVASDPDLGWVTFGTHRGRVFRGLTAAGKKMRGLRTKGMGSEKVR